jgi:hypothetical protein
VNTAGGAFPGSDFVPLPASDAAPKENKGFGGAFAGANGDGFESAPPISWGFAPPPGTPNSTVDSLVAAAVGSDCPWVAELVLSPALVPDTANVAPLVGRPVVLPSLVAPNGDGWFACAPVVLVVNALLKEFTVGCIVGVDELFDAPKLNVGFGGSDEVGAATELDGGAVATLFVIPKLNFGLDASPVPPAGGALALGLELVLVDVEELGACENEKRLWGAGPLP